MAGTLRHNTHGNIRGMIQIFAGNVAHCAFFHAGIPVQTEKNGSCINALHLSLFWHLSNEFFRARYHLHDGFQNPVAIRLALEA